MGWIVCVLCQLETSIVWYATAVSIDVEAGLQEATANIEWFMTGSY